MARLPVRFALIAALAALALSVPAAALGQTGRHSQGAQRGRAALAAWARQHDVRALPAGRRPSAPRAATNYQGVLESVVAVSPTVAFAVGYMCSPACHTPTGTQTLSTLILQWDGTSWTQDPSPSPSPYYTALYGVSARSATDAWAVGTSCNGCDPSQPIPYPGDVSQTLILHWDGSTWSQVPSADPGTGINELTAVSEDSPTDAWAVGMTCAGSCKKQLSLTEHWNGTAWSRVASPNTQATYNFLTAVSAQSRAQVWATGTAALHWTGTKWSAVPFPQPSNSSDMLYGTTALSATSAWIVGMYSSTKSPTVQTLALRWNGKKWARAASPDLYSGLGDNELYGVMGRSATDVWAVGMGCDSGCHSFAATASTLIEHWNGKKWSLVASPTPGNGGYDSLAGVSADTASDAWAVGQWCAANCGTSTEVDDTLILHWDGHTWSVS